MRIFYSLLTWLLQIPLAVYWLFRGLVNGSYRDRVGQRFGIGYPKLSDCIWIHAVSVGEVQAAVPLIQKIIERYPGHRLLITTVTPTGASRIRDVFGDTVTHCYIPFELPPAVNRFFASVRPELALIMETEIWPNLYRGCGVRNIPLILVSARISPKSLHGYRRFLPLFRETLSHGIIIAAQSRADADRFRVLGASSVRTWVTGNIKFDIELPKSLPNDGLTLRAELFGARPVWIAASTHEQEEEQVLIAHRQLQRRYPDLLLVLVPRHPERFKEVAALIRSHRFEFVARTDGASCRNDTDVYLVNTLGELRLFYAACDVAFVGGSLVSIGGHNLLEPAALGVPVISGPHMFNAQEIADMFLDVGACRTVSNSEELAVVVSEWIANPKLAKEIGARGRDLVASNRGALQRLLELLEPLIENVDNGRRPSGSGA
ncbi:MAG: lipid IV(A) 3-deoxy-D-manno-octulosonic acid transferase [Gammaproteobacteria bacterium]|nr:lipid IV(A) 3-deoxy-D-manno-octulosonic acid transferase [Gammaproteobacteria bacterium]